MKFPAPRILIIDDDCDSYELMQFMLEQANASYQITGVSAPKEGLRLAAARRFDLYLLDYRMNDIDGVEVCRILRQTDTKTPIMFFTSEAHQSVRQEAMLAGANAYLIKPDDLKELTGTVKRLLGVHKLADRRDMAANNYNGSAVSA
jgi:CheY-like chemotaxis protein